MGFWPDHPFAIEPNELKEMIENIITTEDCLETKSGAYSESEENMLKAQRSVVAAKNIKKGDTLSLNNLTTMRPLLPHAICASRFYSILGRNAARDISKNTILFSDDI